MSNDALKWAYSQDLKRSGKSVLVALADYANTEFICWPSIATLAKKVGYGRSTVLEATKELERLGFISKKYSYNSLGKRVGVTYRLNIPLSPETVARESSKANNTVFSDSLSPVDTRLSPVNATLRPDLSLTKSSSRTQTIIEPKEKPQVTVKDIQEKTHSSPEKVSELMRQMLSPEIQRQMERERQKRKGALK